jgi:hypothetical protein
LQKQFCFKLSRKTPKSRGIFAKSPLSSSLERQVARWLLPHRPISCRDARRRRCSGREDKALLRRSSLSPSLPLLPRSLALPPSTGTLAPVATDPAVLHLPASSEHALIYASLCCTFWTKESIRSSRNRRRRRHFPRRSRAPPPSIRRHLTFPAVAELRIVFRVSWPPPLLFLPSEPLLRRCAGRPATRAWSGACTAQDEASVPLGLLDRVAC